MSSLHRYGMNSWKSLEMPLIDFVYPGGLIYVIKDIEELEVPGNFDNIYKDISCFY